MVNLEAVQHVRVYPPSLISISRRIDERSMAIAGHRCLREVAFKNIVSLLNLKSFWRGRFHPPTLAVESVKLFNVVLLPEEGLPTSPIRGSRGMLCDRRQFKPLFHGCFWCLF